MYNPSEPMPPIVMLFSIYLLFGASFTLGMMSATAILLMAQP